MHRYVVDKNMYRMYYLLNTPDVPPAPGESAALELGDGVDPPPAKQTCTTLDMAKHKYACFEPILPGDVKDADLKVQYAIPETCTASRPSVGCHSFMKNKLRNRLDMRLETCMHMKLQTFYKIRTFPCLEAYEVWEDAGRYGAKVG